MSLSRPFVSTSPASPVTEPIIDIRRLVKRYKEFTAVNGIDLHVLPGEIFGILGPNGAGKTTTLEMIEGLRTPDAGTIRVNGIDAVANSTAVRKIIGVQLQSTSMFPYLSARELVELFGKLYGIEHPRERADDLLAKVDLTEKANARVEELSGGQQQRLSIALALVNAPIVTFLDEPTTGLDPHARRSLWQTILDVRAAGSTVVLTTHYMDEAESLCDRIAIMDGGEVIACDTPEELIRALPQDAVVSARSIGNEGNSIPTEELQAIPGVTHVVQHESGDGHLLKLSTTDVQATLVGTLQLAERHGLTLAELNSTRADLEDVFLALTGRSYDTGEAAPPAEPAPKRRRRRLF